MGRASDDGPVDWVPRVAYLGIHDDSYAMGPATLAFEALGHLTRAFRAHNGCLQPAKCHGVVPQAVLEGTEPSALCRRITDELGIDVGATALTTLGPGASRAFRTVESFTPAQVNAPLDAAPDLEPMRKRLREAMRHTIGIRSLVREQPHEHATQIA